MAPYEATVMKTKCSLLSMFACACMALMLATACGKGDDPSPNPNPTPNPPDPPVSEESLSFSGTYSSGRADFGADGTTVTVTFNSSGDWNVTVPQASRSWCNASPESGTAGDNQQVQIKVAPNTTYDERNASLTFTTGSLSKTFVVTQKQFDAMLLASSSKVEVEEDGGEFSVTVSSNVDVSYEIPSQYAGWLHFKGKSGSRALADTQFTFTADKNTTGSSRQGSITFSGAGTTEVVNVLQEGGSTLVLSEKEIYVNSQGGRFSVEVRSNCEFSFAVGEGSEWLREDVSRAMSSHTIYFIAEANEDLDSDRRATVTFTSADGSVQDVLTVTQRQKGALVCGAKTLETECAGGTFPIEYSSNGSSVRATVPDWISITNAPATSRAMTSYNIYIKVAPNLSMERREGYVKLSTSDDSARDSVLVTQKGLEYSVTTSIQDGDFPDARSHEFTVEVSSPIEAELEAVAPIEKVSTTRFRIPANYQRGSMGSAAVQIRLAGIVIDPVMVKYAAPVEPTFELDDIRVPAAAGSATVNIKTNTDITASMPSDASWIKLRQVKNAERGLATDSWVFELEENTIPYSRTAVISFYAGNFWSGQAAITQEGATPPVQNEDEVNVSSEGTLEETLGNRMMTVDKLAINGGVNGKDVSTLREMATNGALVELDLSSTELRKDLQNQYYQGDWRPGKMTEDNMIGHYMFYKTNIRSVTLPKNLKSIGYYAFRESQLEEIDIPSGVTFIDEQAFRNCKKLRKAVVPGTVTDIPESCFEGATSLSSVTLGEGIRTIGRWAFVPYQAYTTQGELREIKLPSTLEEIGKMAFLSTKISEIEIPASVTKIGEYAFSECRNLSKVVFNCSMDTLPKRVLHNTLGVQEIVFPRGLKVIGEYALDHIGIEYLTIPEGVTELMTGACNGTARKGLTLPESLEKIGAYALGYRSECTSFTIPSKVSFIGKRAFDGACYIKELHIKNPVPPTRDGEIFFSTFSYADCTLYVPKGSAAAYSDDSYWLKFKAIVEE